MSVEGAVTAMKHDKGIGRGGKAGRKRRRQVAALPCRRDADGALLVLLVTSRETGRWVAPKGWPIPGLDAAGSAAREAWEEAGVRGVISLPPLGRYTYEKRLSPEKARRVQVEAHRLDVIDEADDWPERAQRARRWFPPAEAASLVAEKGLAKLIRNLENEA